MSVKRRKLNPKCSRGSDVSEEDRCYIVENLKLLAEGFSAEEDKHVFVENVLEELSGKEIQLAGNNVGSRCLEGLLNNATSSQQVERIANALSSKFRSLCTDKFGSHVLQTLIQVAARFGKEDCNKDLTEVCDKLICFVLNNAEDFMVDVYGNHVMRTALESATSVNDATVNKKSKATEEVTQKSAQFVSLKVRKSVEALTEQLAKSPEISDLAATESSSCVLQTLLFVLHSTDPSTCQLLIDSLTSQVFCEQQSLDQLFLLFGNKSCVRLLEGLLKIAPQPTVKTLWSNLFEGHVVEIAKHQVGNYTLQRFIDYCDDKEHFEEMCEELFPCMKSILKLKHTGVMLSLAKACTRLAAKQSFFVSSLMDILKCKEPVERQLQIVPVVLSLCKYSKVDLEAPQIPITLHGSLILQQMLYFSKPIKLVDSFLNLQIVQLKNLATDRKGSYTVDAFFSSKFIGEKSRFKFLNKIKDNLPELACNQSGSRCLDKMWEKGDLKQRTLIAQSLATCITSLSSNNFGKFLVWKCALKLFLKKPEDWREVQIKDVKTKNMFADIVGDVKGSSVKKKRK